MCPSNCATCDSNGTACLSCPVNTFLRLGTCPNCPANEGNPSNNSLSSCSISSCSTGYFVANNSCVPDCRNISGCVTCASPGICQACNSIYTFTTNGGCIFCNISYCLTCNQNMICASCSNSLQGVNCQILCAISNCNTCSSNNTCVTCSTPFTLLNSSFCSCEAPFMVVNNNCQCNVEVYSYIPYGPYCLPNCLIAYCLTCSNNICSLCI